MSQPSATFDPAPSSEGHDRTIPPWLAGAAAATFLVGIGVLIYWFVGGKFVGTTDFIPDPDHARQVSQRRGPLRGNVDGVQVLPNRGSLVRAGGAFMEVDAPSPDGKRPTNYRFRYDSQALLTAEQWHLAQGVRQTSDPQWAKTLAITPAQQARLRKLGGITMDLSSADRDKLIAAWGQYEQAKDKSAAERTLVALLKDASGRALPATKAKAVARVAEFNQIFTPEQVRELTKLGAGEKVTPIAAAKPATAPVR